MNRCLTYLVVYTKLNSVGHIFHGGHSHESTRLTRSNNSIPRSINLLFKSFFILWFKDDTSWKKSLQWRKIRHSYQATHRTYLRVRARNQPGVTSFGPISGDDTVIEYRAKTSGCAREVNIDHVHITPSLGELGKRERQREKDFLSFGSLPFLFLKGIGNSRVAVYRTGKKIYISPSWPSEWFRPSNHPDLVGHWFSEHFRQNLTSQNSRNVRVNSAVKQFPDNLGETAVLDCISRLSMKSPRLSPKFAISSCQ